MKKKTFSFELGLDVPAQVGPFAHATKWGNQLYVTGQMPTDPQTGLVVEGGILAQATQVRKNLEAVLARFGATLDGALMVRVYLEDFADFDELNDLYRTWFLGPLPSRTCIGSHGLAVGSLIEIDLIVGLPDGAHA